MTDEEDLVRRRRLVQESEEYQAMDDKGKAAINGMLGLLELEMVPPDEMAKTVMMAAIGTTLVENQTFMKLAEHGVHHVKGTNDIVILAGGWAFRLSAVLYDEDDVPLDQLEEM